MNSKAPRMVPEPEPSWPRRCGYCDKLVTVPRDHARRCKYYINSDEPYQRPPRPDAIPCELDWCDQEECDHAPPLKGAR